jgi:hypothetical protein
MLMVNAVEGMVAWLPRGDRMRTITSVQRMVGRTRLAGQGRINARRPRFPGFPARDRIPAAPDGNAVTRRRRVRRPRSKARRGWPTVTMSMRAVWYDGWSWASMASDGAAPVASRRCRWPARRSRVGEASVSDMVSLWFGRLRSGDNGSSAFGLIPATRAAPTGAAIEPMTPTPHPGRRGEPGPLNGPISPLASELLVGSPRRKLEAQDRWLRMSRLPTALAVGANDHRGTMAMSRVIGRRLGLELMREPPSRSPECLMVEPARGQQRHRQRAAGVVQRCQG